VNQWCKFIFGGYFLLSTFCAVLLAYCDPKEGKKKFGLLIFQIDLLDANHAKNNDLKGLRKFLEGMKGGQLISIEFAHLEPEKACVNFIAPDMRCNFSKTKEGTSMKFWLVFGIG